MNRWKTLIIAAAAFLFMPLVGHADPIGYNFSQGGFQCFDEFSENGEDSDEPDGPSNPCEEVPEDLELTVAGMFFGEDGNDDGFLNSDDEEVTGFMLQLLAYDEVIYELDIDDVDEGEFFLNYELGGDTLGDNEDEVILLFALLEDEFAPESLIYIANGGDDEFLPCESEGICGILVLGDEEPFSDDSIAFVTSELVAVSPKRVSEPGTMMLLGAGLIGIGLMRRKRQAKL